MEDNEVNKQENEIFKVISDSLMALCIEKPKDPVYFLATKMLEQVGENINKLNLNLYERINNDNKLLFTAVDKLSNKSFVETYIILKKLGSGYQGRVYLAELRSDRTNKYAVKILDKKDDAFISESTKNKLCKLDHRNLVNVIEILDEENYIYIVYDYCEHGNILSYLNKLFDMNVTRIKKKKKVHNYKASKTLSSLRDKSKVNNISNEDNTEKEYLIQENNTPKSNSKEEENLINKTNIKKLNNSNNIDEETNILNNKSITKSINKTFNNTNTQSEDEDFHKFKINSNNLFIKKSVLIDICKQIFIAIKVLHDNGISYKDLKPENILVFNIEQFNNSDNNTKFIESPISKNKSNFKYEKTSNELSEDIYDKKKNDFDLSNSCIQIKLTDFGFSEYTKESNEKNNWNKVPSSIVFKSPESLKGEYVKKSDIWTAGVIMYLLLSGRYPFSIKDKNSSDVIFSILNENIEYNIENNYSCFNNYEIDLLSQIFEKDPLERIDINSILEHEVFSDFNKSLDDNNNYSNDSIIEKKNILENSDIMKHKNSSIRMIETLDNLSNFTVGRNFRQIVLNYICKQKLFKEKNFEMSKLFQEADINNDGSIDAHELLSCYHKFFPGTTEDQLNNIKKMISKIDINKNGKIDYSEFMLLTSNFTKENNKQIIKEVFNYFDSDNNGYIEISDLACTLKDEKIDNGRMQEMINEFDQNNDGIITFDEFYQILDNYN